MVHFLKNESLRVNFLFIIEEPDTGAQNPRFEERFHLFLTQKLLGCGAVHQVLLSDREK